MYKHNDVQKHGQEYVHAVGQANGQADTQTAGQTDVHTDGHTDIDAWAVGLVDITNTWEDKLFKQMCK